jgi:hypothetical protein
MIFPTACKNPELPLLLSWAVRSEAKIRESFQLFSQEGKVKWKEKQSEQRLAKLEPSSLD